MSLKQSGKVMLALVSEQAIPNVMATLQSTPRPERVVCIVSAEKDNPKEYDKTFERVYQSLQAVLGALGIVVERRAPVHPYDLAAVRVACAQVIAEYSRDALVFNITGGTKVMALGAYLAALEADVPIVYVETRDRKLIELQVEGVLLAEWNKARLTSCPRDFDEAAFKPIDVPTYLQAYGKKIASERKYEMLTTREIQAAEAIVAHLPNSFACLQMLIRDGEGNTRSVPARVEMDAHAEIDALAEILHALNCLEWDAKQRVGAIVTPAQFNFLSGGWLEVFTFHQLKTSGYFDDVRANVKLENTRGELDIVLTARAALGICECKFGATTSLILGKLRGLKDALGGTYGRTFYITARDSLTDDIQNLVQLYGVTSVFTAGDLPHLAEKIVEKFK
jgi:hypothetical protein